MKILVCNLMVISLLLAACASTDKDRQTAELYSKYHAHCSEHARTALATSSPDQDSLYRECMDYFVGTDVHCPYCVVDPHMKK